MFFVDREAGVLQLAQEVFIAAKVLLFLAGELSAAFAAAAGAVARKRRRVVNFCWVSFWLVVAALVCVTQTEVACTAAVMHRSLVAAFPWVSKAVEG